MQDLLRVLFRVAAADAAHGTTTEIPNAVGGVPYLLPPAPQSLGVGQRSRESAGCYVQPPMAVFVLGQWKDIEQKARRGKLENGRLQQIGKL